MQIAVIGAGIVGASVAAHAAEAGAVVTLLDRSTPGGGTSGTSYAWVNANGKEPDAYFALNAAGVRAHHDLARDGAPWFVAGGHLEMAVDEAHERHLATRVARMRERGYPVQEVTRDRAQQLAPDLVVPRDSRALVFFPDEAHVFPQPYIARMLGRARTAGAQVHTGADVRAVEPRNGGAVVHTGDGREFAADAVVSAVGRWTADLARLAGAEVPIAGYTEPGDVTVGYLATTSPVPVELDRLLTTPWLNVRPDGAGRLLVQALDLDATADPSDVPPPGSALAGEYLRRLRDVLPGAEGARIERLVVGQRAMPADGRTIVGRTVEHPWLYVVATHSGVTLAPLLGQGVARELLGGDEPLFADFRPTRFTAGVSVAPPPGPRKPGEQ